MERENRLQEQGLSLRLPGFVRRGFARWWPRLEQLAAWLLLAGGLYWAWLFYLADVGRIQLPEVLLRAAYQLDYGSSVAFLCCGLLALALVTAAGLYLLRFGWNLLADLLHRHLPRVLIRLLYGGLLLVLLLTGIEQVATIKNRVCGYWAQASVLIVSVTYKSQLRAQSFGEFVRLVNSGMLE